MTSYLSNPNMFPYLTYKQQREVIQTILESRKNGGKSYHYEMKVLMDCRNTPKKNDEKTQTNTKSFKSPTIDYPSLPPHIKRKQRYYK